MAEFVDYHQTFVANGSPASVDSSEGETVLAVFEVKQSHYEHIEGISLPEDWRNVLAPALYMENAGIAVRYLVYQRMVTTALGDLALSLPGGMDMTTHLYYLTLAEGEIVSSFHTAFKGSAQVNDVVPFSGSMVADGALLATVFAQRSGIAM